MNASTRDLCMRTATELATDIAQGRLRSETLVRACLERVAQREPVVRAWAHLDAEQALAQARERDAQAASGVLHGLPVGWKDVIDCQGQPTGCGSPIYRDHRAAVDAGAAAMARRAGAIALGKTVTAEFAGSQPGPTTNPHHAGHTPGGSSSGSAAAVAAGMVPLALGTQTGGSVIRPASFCGVVGFKPSFGLINRHGVKQVSDSLDTVGTFARTVADTALLTAGVTGRRDFLDLQPQPPRRVLLCPAPQGVAPDACVVEALERTAQALSQAGVPVMQPAVPAAWAAMVQAHRDIEYFELARALQHEALSHGPQLSAALRSRIETGLALDPAAYEAALATRAQCQHLLAQEVLNSEGDLLLTPSAPGEAPEGLSSTGQATFNRLWTALGVPCITLPAGTGPRGLPLGVQFVAAARQDARLLGHAAWIERLLA